MRTNWIVIETEKARVMRKRRRRDEAEKVEVEEVVVVAGSCSEEKDWVVGKESRMREKIIMESW